MRAQTPTPPSDVLIFINGEQLTGTLERADSDGVTFNSAMAGEITVKWANIRQLRSPRSFAALPKDVQLSREDALKLVPQGSVDASATTLTTSQAATPTAKLEILIDTQTFTKAVEQQTNLLQSWAGTLTGGVSIVRNEQNSTTYTGAVNLVRAVPLVTWLPPRSRTLVNFNQSYGTVMQPGVAEIETNVFQANAERDQYISPRIYLFGGATFDHNFGQSLQLQQSDGAGVGITFFKLPLQQFDLRADIHYESQSFIDPTQNQSIIGSTFYETYFRHLPRSIQLTEAGSISPAWNNENDYSAHINGNLVFPVYQGLGFNVGVTDDYLNNAPPGSSQNSFQFTTGLTYTLKPR